jgi:uncharacterized protein
MRVGLRHRLWFVLMSMLLGVPACQGLPDELAAVCDDLVYDRAGVLGGAHGTALITTTAQGLQRLGVDLRVRTVRTLGDLALGELLLEAQCRSWQSGILRRKSTLLVLMVSPDGRTFGLYYGEAWKGALDDDRHRITDEIMAPRFRAGDYVGGFVEGMQHIERRLIAFAQHTM